MSTGISKKFSAALVGYAGRPVHIPRMGKAAIKDSVRWFVREWRLKKQLTQGQLAELCDTATAVISLLETGKRPMQDHWIGLISTALGVEPADLLRDPAHDDPHPVSVPLVSWVSAGAFREVSQAMPTDEFPSIETVGLPPGDWFALAVEGDSMDRISPPGSIIFVNRRDKKLVPNACYVIANEAGEATYKRYRPLPERFEPVSTNPNHDPIFPDGVVNVIGRVRRSRIDL